MPIDITMPALSPTMETGTLAKWIVKVGDSVKSGDILCEIETDKATMEVESIDEGVVAELLVAEGAEEIPVGQVIARLSGEGEVVAPAVAAPTPHPAQPSAESPSPARGEGSVAAPSAPSPLAGEGDSAIAERGEGLRVNASPLARRLAQAQGIDLAAVRGSGPNGRVVKADLAGASTVSSVAAPSPRSAGAESPSPARGEGQGVASAKAPAFVDTGIPHEAVKLSNMRKTIARRLAESKATIPHIYLTVDIRLDALLKLRGELNAALEPRGIKLSVNDMLIKALAAALIEVPACNVSFAGDTLIKYSRADISVAVSVPTGLITPIIADASNKALSAISTEMKALADKAKAGKLQPHEFQGGTASLSNMGMYGIKQFEAVINPPQGMIMAIGAGEKRPYVVNDALAIATVMSATGSFDHRAIDGADGAQLMKVFKELCESPLGLVA
jgi:pyruvate dehydrogenase E2 component (dihydrolipoamide acetyltransferase)